MARVRVAQEARTATVRRTSDPEDLPGCAGITEETARESAQLVLEPLTLTTPPSSVRHSSRLVSVITRLMETW